MDKTNFNLLIDKMNYSIGEQEMVYDEFGTPINYIFKYANQTFCDAIGVAKEEIIGKTLFEMFPKTDKIWLEMYNEVLETGESKEFVRFTKQFNRYFNVNCFPSRPGHFVTVFKDVTDLVNEQEEITNDRELLRTISESSKAAFFEMDIRNGEVTYSDNFEDIVGKKDITIKTYLTDFLKLTHPQDLRKVINLNRDIIKGKIDESTIEMRFFNEELDDYIWINLFVYVSKKLRHLPLKIKGFIRDVTNGKRVELDLMETEKLFTEARKVANVTTFLYFPDIQSFENSKELSDFLGIEGNINLNAFRKIVHPEDLIQFDNSTIKILEDGIWWRKVSNI